MNLKNPSVSVVIPNYNGHQLLAKNLPQVIKATRGAEIIVVDDASTDDSVNFINDNFPQVKTVVHQKNRRFAAACNTGVEHASGDIIILLNTDVIPENGFLGPLIKWFNNPDIFAVGCAEYDGNQVSGRSGGDFKRGLFIHWRAGNQTKTTTLWVAGGSSAYRKKYWQQLGGMDPLFAPAYEEDRDLSYRALKQGYAIAFEPKSHVLHQHETTNIKELGFTLIKAASYRNHFLLVWKNITSRRLLFSHLMWLPYRLIYDSLRSKGLPVIGFIWAITFLPQIIKKRRQSIPKVADETIINTYKKL